MSHSWIAHRHHPCQSSCHPSPHPNSNINLPSDLILLRIPHHAVQLKTVSKEHRTPTTHPTYHARILSIPTLHLLPHPKAQALINRHIRDTLRTLQITLRALLIRLMRHSLEQQFPNPLPLCRRTNSNNITEIVSLRIIPNSSLRFSLSLLPNPIPIRPQPPTTQVSDVIEELAERQAPRLEPGIPALRLGFRVGRYPAGNA